jgi:hypothetical protein
MHIKVTGQSLKNGVTRYQLLMPIILAIWGGEGVLDPKDQIQGQP